MGKCSFSPTPAWYQVEAVTWPAICFHLQLMHTHFSDYSLYPDRFSDQEPSSSQPIRRNSLSSDPSSSASNSSSNHPHNSVPISKYNFRIRCLKPKFCKRPGFNVRIKSQLNHTALYNRTNFLHYLIPPILGAFYSNENNYFVYCYWTILAIPQ